MPLPDQKHVKALNHDNPGRPIGKGGWVISGLSTVKAKVMVKAIVLLQMLKGVISIANEEPASRAMLLAEVRKLVRTYFASAS